MNKKFYFYCLIAILYGLFLDFVIGLNQEKMAIQAIVFLLLAILNEVTDNKKEG